MDNNDQFFLQELTDKYLRRAQRVNNDKTPGRNEIVTCLVCKRTYVKNGRVHHEKTRYHQDKLNKAIGTIMSIYD